MATDSSRAVAAALLAFCVPIAHAQAPRGDAAADFPNKPIRIVIGFTPGGGPDITARYLAQKLTETWKQQVVVDNRPGAGGTVGAHIVARSTPDGYTLLSVSPAHAVAPALSRSGRVSYTPKERSCQEQSVASCRWECS